MQTDSDHLVLGLIAEEKPGFFGTGITIETARGIVEQMSGSGAGRKVCALLPDE